MTDILKWVMTEEDFSPTVYQDSLGYWTIGYGLCVDPRKRSGLTEGEARWILSKRLGEIAWRLEERLGGVWGRMNLPRRAALVNMAYQLGVEGLFGFTKMIDAVRIEDWYAVHREALDSKWAREDTPERARRVAETLLTGKYPELA